MTAACVTEPSPYSGNRALSRGDVCLYVANIGI